MAARRFSQLQKRLLAWLATDERRTRGMIASSHQDLVGALQEDKGLASRINFQSIGVHHSIFPCAVVKNDGKWMAPEY